MAWGSFEAGTVFRRATGSEGARYLVNAVACSCPDYQQHGHICKHIRAVVLFEQRQRRPATTPLRHLADLTGGCAATGCPEDREPHERFCLEHVTVDAF